MSAEMAYLCRSGQAHQITKMILDFRSTKTGTTVVIDEQGRKIEYSVIRDGIFTTKVLNNGQVL